MINPQDLLSEADAARQLGRSRQWLRDMRLRGEGPRYIALGRRPLYDPADLSAWLEKCKQDPIDNEVK